MDSKKNQMYIVELLINNEVNVEVVPKIRTGC